jgi:hypothetical protein
VISFKYAKQSDSGERAGDGGKEENAEKEEDTFKEK